MSQVLVEREVEDPKAELSEGRTGNVVKQQLLFFLEKLNLRSCHGMNKNCK